jgi:hypothetical protein
MKLRIIFIIKKSIKYWQKRAVNYKVIKLHLPRNKLLYFSCLLNTWYKLIFDFNSFSPFSFHNIFQKLTSTWPQNRAKMVLQFNKTVILCLLAISCLSVDARRRSRVDATTKLASEISSTTAATITAASATSEKIEAEKLEASAPTTLRFDDEERTSESNSSEESPSYEDCDIDNISFELITG